MNIFHGSENILEQFANGYEILYIGFENLQIINIK